MSDFAEKIVELGQRQVELTKAYKALEDEFQTRITDKSVPLMERWAMFMEAPSQLKEQLDWMPHSVCAGFQHAKENWFNAPEIYGRGKEIEFAEMVDERLVEDGQLNPNARAVGGKTPEEVEKRTIDFLEEMLDLRLETFCYDW